MDLSASSRLITSALTSLEPAGFDDEGVDDEIHPAKDDNGSSAAANTIAPSQDNIKQEPQQMLNNSFESSGLIIPVPHLHFATSTPSHNSHNSHYGASVSDMSHVSANHSQDSMVVSTNQSTDQSSMVSPSLPADVSHNTGDLVLAAISVMKGRKARPDTKRLCNWVHRKYGRSVQEVVNEIDNLCAHGVLEKVEYKGSISFRIVSDKKLHKRAGRRKSSNVNQSETEASNEPRPKTETPKRVPAGKKSPKKIVEKSPDSSQPLTVHFIVNELLSPGPDQVVTKDEIVNAIEAFNGPINKKNVFRDLETILAQEIHLGYLKKINDDGFSLLKVENSKTYRGTIALKVSKRKPKPTQKLLEMEAAEQQQTKVKCEPMDDVFDPENNENGDANASNRTEDQLKDDLIKEKLISNKLFKMKNKIKATKNKKMKLQNELNPMKNVINELHEKQNNLKNSIDEVLESTEDNKGDEKKLKKKKESWQTNDKEPEKRNVFVEKPNNNPTKKRKKVAGSALKNGMNGAAKNRVVKSRPSPKPSNDYLDDEDDRASPLQRSVSGRKKRARKIFDPADHDLPQRAAKRSRVSSPALSVDERTRRSGERGPVTRSPAPVARRRGKQRQSKSVDPESDTDTEYCLYCDQGDLQNEKLVTCNDCSTIVHPSCLNYPEDLTDQIYAQPWQCINCKTCCLCKEAGEDDQMLFCDSCDLGYHMLCHVPSISGKPQGRWECSTCTKHTGFVAPPSASSKPPEPELPLEQQFEAEIPALPPGTGNSWQERGIKVPFRPLPDLHPVDWESLPVDDTIPDISSWSAARVCQYLVQNGIQETHAKIFFDEEIDGSSVLVMQRKDIISGLGLKLGPALKIFNRVRTLQTRRKFEMF